MKIRSNKHRKFISEQPCIITGRTLGVQSHHLLRVEGKGMGTKTSDIWCIPLHWEVHAALHKNGNEVAFFVNHGLDYEMVKAVALRFSSISSDKKIRESVEKYLTIT